MKKRCDGIDCKKAGECQLFLRRENSKLEFVNSKYKNDKCSYFQSTVLTNIITKGLSFFNH
jgi:hypothetical protein